jgi:hypothetical protein
MPDGAEDLRGRGDPGGLSALLGDLARTHDLDPADWEAFFHAGRVVGRFELLREIGRGGFGVVFEARDSELGRSVAFKALRPGPGARARAGQKLLRREAEAAAHLNHPNICTLFDVGRCEGGPYLVLERLEGETLEEVLQREPLPPDRAMAIATQVARALAHAHAAGVVHRDLKPANVFLTGRGEVKVLDFGLAHFLGETTPGLGGSPAYMAPEQWRGEATDARADVFALGVLLFEMIAGRRPFETEHDRSTVLDSGPAPALSPAQARAPVAALVASMLAKSPADRPANGQVVLERLIEIQQPSGRVARFVDELYRRRVPGATTAYLAGAFVALLVAEVVAWVLDLPRWVLNAAAMLVLVGLPVNVVLAWYFDVVPGDGASRALPRKPGSAAVGVLVALAVVGAAWRWWPRPEPAVGAPVRIAVADFANGTDDRDLEGLSGLLSTALEQSRRLAVMSRGRMVEILAGTGAGGDGRIDEARGREVARRAGIEVLVVASVHRFDDVYVMEMKALDPATGDHLFTFQERDRGKASIPGLIDRLAAQVRERLRSSPRHDAHPSRAT